MRAETSRGSSSDSTGFAEAVLGFGSELFTLLDTVGLITWASPSYQSVLSYAPATLLNTSLLDYAHPDDLAQVQTALAAAVAQPEHSSHVAYRHRQSDGS
jgi:hypothetical protein